MLNHARIRILGLALVAAVAVALTACAQSVSRNEPTPTQVAPQPTDTAVPATPPPTVEPTSAPTAEPTATATVIAEESPTPTPTPVVSPTTNPVPTATGSPTALPVNNTQTYTLTLEIEGLSDESIVRGDSIFARGQTSPDAVVSVNGVIVAVSATGYFEFSLKLDPGPNPIEVVASDLSGNQVSTTLAIFSQPEELS